MEEHQFDTDSDSISFPDDTVVGIVNDPDDAEAAVGALVANGVPEDQISVLCCQSGARRLDPSGERHGLLGRLQRIVQHFGDQEAEHLRIQTRELEAGHFLIAVPAVEEERDRISGILAAHGGHFVNHYGTWTVTRLEA